MKVIMKSLIKFLSQTLCGLVLSMGCAYGAEGGTPLNHVIAVGNDLVVLDDPDPIALVTFREAIRAAWSINQPYHIAVVANSMNDPEHSNAMMQNPHHSVASWGPLRLWLFQGHNTDPVTNTPIVSIKIFSLQCPANVVLENITDQDLVGAVTVLVQTVNAHQIEQIVGHAHAQQVVHAMSPVQQHNFGTILSFAGAHFDAQVIGQMALAYPQLRGLYFSHVALIQLPDEIIQLPALEFLDLFSTGITTLPVAIGHLVHLKWIRADNTPLASLPNEIGNLTELTKLQLANTQLALLPEGMSNLHHLENVTFDHTPFASSAGYAQWYTQLVENNPGVLITPVPTHVTHINHIRRFYTAGTKNLALSRYANNGIDIHQIDAEVFAQIAEQFPQLKRLTLHRNIHLAHLSAAGVNLLLNLRVLNVSNTQLAASGPEFTAFSEQIHAVHPLVHIIH